VETLKRCSRRRVGEEMLLYLNIVKCIHLSKYHFAILLFKFKFKNTQREPVHCTFDGEWHRSSHGVNTSLLCSMNEKRKWVGDRNNQGAIPKLMPYHQEPPGGAINLADHLLVRIWLYKGQPSAAGCEECINKPGDFRVWTSWKTRRKLEERKGHKQKHKMRGQGKVQAAVTRTLQGGRHTVL
jgi:hypothetical protein